jgi:hypothetical protein
VKRFSVVKRFSSAAPLAVFGQHRLTGAIQIYNGDIFGVTHRDGATTPRARALAEKRAFGFCAAERKKANNDDESKVRVLTCRISL